MGTADAGGIRDDVRPRRMLSPDDGDGADEGAESFNGRGDVDKESTDRRQHRSSRVLRCELARGLVRWERDTGGRGVREGT